MKDAPTKCPCCGEVMVPAETALNRSAWNAIFLGLGSSVLQVRPRGGGTWMDYMSPSVSAAASFCASCGALLMAPPLPEMRRKLGFD